MTRYYCKRIGKPWIKGIYPRFVSVQRFLHGGVLVYGVWADASKGCLAYLWTLLFRIRMRIFCGLCMYYFVGKTSILHLTPFLNMYDLWGKT
jgi:hypothetical protein